MNPTAPVLVVDDDEDIRDMVRMTLIDEGYEVLTATHGADALALLGQRTPRVILLDMRMPVMDGWEFAEAYRRMPGPHAPIVLLTAANDAAGRAAEIDAEGVLAKPFPIDQLLEAVGRFADAPGATQTKPWGHSEHGKLVGG